MSFTDAIKNGFQKYTDFSGVEARPAYWWWILFTVLVGLATNAIWDGLGTAWNIAILLPTIAIGVRRLRDAGYHWAWLFLGLVPIIGGIVLIVFLTQPSKAAAEEA